MEDFNIKKREYLEKLRENPDYVQGVLNSKDNSTRSLEIILDPKTDIELSIAEALYIMFTDILYLTDNVYELEPNDLDSVEFVSFFSEMIIALKNNDEIRINELKEIAQNRLSPEFVGKIIFQFTREMIYDYEELLVHLCEKCGFDPSDSLAIAQFQVYFNKTNEIFNSISGVPNSKEVNTYLTPEMANMVNRFITGFHDEFNKAFEHSKRR
jgi:hypothetical protein